MQLLGNFRDFEIAKGGPFALSAIIRDLKISLIIAEMQKNCKGGTLCIFLQLLGKFEDP